MAIGERWMVYWEPTTSWRPAEIVNEAGKRVELKFTDTPAARDLSNTLQRRAMKWSTVRNSEIASGDISLTECLFLRGRSWLIFIRARIWYCRFHDRSS
jgi:hypothetical protein